MIYIILQSSLMKAWPTSFKLQCLNGINDIRLVIKRIQEELIPGIVAKLHQSHPGSVDADFEGVDDAGGEVLQWDPTLVVVDASAVVEDQYQVNGTVWNRQGFIQCTRVVPKARGQKVIKEYYMFITQFTACIRLNLEKIHIP